MSDEKSAKAELKDEMLKQVKSPQFVVVALLFVVFELVIVFGIDTSSRREELQWHWLSLYFLILCGLTPITMDSKLFFRGGIDDATDTQSAPLAGSSALISWIFAKSITNASKKGGSYGICGGFGYAAWYLAFPSAAAATSSAARATSRCPAPSTPNERASNDDLRKFAKSYSHWGLFQWVPAGAEPAVAQGGMDMFALGAVQGGFSYALFDPSRPARSAVAQTLGTVLFSFINIIMVTSGISTLDSTFTPVAKLVGPDAHGFLTTGKPMPSPTRPRTT
ncbi:hypothetical protein JL720_7213 [Aureococcus anophagefferens]|nr:hypothetical protein JL720_7213 [Aureococcus anophagefferens]